MLIVIGLALLLAGGYLFAFPEKAPAFLRTPQSKWWFLGAALIGLGLFIGGLA